MGVRVDVASRLREPRDAVEAPHELVWFPVERTNDDTVVITSNATIRHADVAIA